MRPKVLTRTLGILAKNVASHGLIRTFSNKYWVVLEFRRLDDGIRDCYFLPRKKIRTGCDRRLMWRVMDITKPALPYDAARLRGVTRLWEPRAGSLQGLLPGAPTDPGVHVKCTRFVTLWNRCPPHDWVVSRWHAGEARYPRRGSNSPSTTRHPLRSTGSGRAVPPLQHYYGALRLLAAHLAALRFLRLAIPSLRPLFVPISSGLSCGSSWSF